MQAFRNVLISLGIIAIILFIVLLIIGVKVVSTVVLYIVAVLAGISVVGLIIYYVGKASGKNESVD